MCRPAGVHFGVCTLLASVPSVLFPALPRATLRTYFARVLGRAHMRTRQTKKVSDYYGFYFFAVSNCGIKYQ
jgi:hypothetical protein